MRLGTTAAICIVVAAVVTGCGSEDSKKSESTGSPAIGMRGLKFVPDRAEVKVGQKVTWTNEEDVDHNVTAKGGAKFMSQAFGRGERYSYTPRAAGTIEYVCTLHPGMKGTLVVAK